MYKLRLFPPAMNCKLCGLDLEREQHAALEEQFFQGVLCVTVVS